MWIRIRSITEQHGNLDHGQNCLCTAQDITGMEWNIFVSRHDHNVCRCDVTVECLKCPYTHYGQFIMFIMIIPSLFFFPLADTWTNPYCEPNRRAVQQKRNLLGVRFCISYCIGTLVLVIGCKSYARSNFWIATCLCFSLKYFSIPDILDHHDLSSVLHSPYL